MLKTWMKIEPHHPIPHGSDPHSLLLIKFIVLTSESIFAWQIKSQVLIKSTWYHWSELVNEPASWSNPRVRWSKSKCSWSLRIYIYTYIYIYNIYIYEYKRDSLLGLNHDPSWSPHIISWSLVTQWTHPTPISRQRQQPSFTDIEGQDAPVPIVSHTYDLWLKSNVTHAQAVASSIDKYTWTTLDSCI
jgi:hypothetical protein